LLIGDFRMVNKKAVHFDDATAPRRSAHRRQSLITNRHSTTNHRSPITDHQSTV